MLFPAFLSDYVINQLHPSILNPFFFPPSDLTRAKKKTNKQTSNRGEKTGSLPRNQSGGGGGNKGDGPEVVAAEKKNKANGIEKESGVGLRPCCLLLSCG